MFELFKLLWDVAVLRDVARKGQLNWRTWVYGFGFAIVEYAIALPAVMLYEKHPQYKPVFIAAMVLVVVNFICFLCGRGAHGRGNLFRRSPSRVLGKPNEELIRN